MAILYVQSGPPQYIYGKMGDMGGFILYLSTRKTGEKSGGGYYIIRKNERNVLANPLASPDTLAAL